MPIVPDPDWWYPMLATIIYTDIVVVPVGQVDMLVVDRLCLALTASFRVPCRAGGPLRLPEHVFNRRRIQYAARDDRPAPDSRDLRTNLGRGGLGLYVEDLKFVFGLADPKGRRAASALLRQRAEFLRRTPSFDRTCSEPVGRLSTSPISLPGAGGQGNG